MLRSLKVAKLQWKCFVFYLSTFYASCGNHLSIRGMNSWPNSLIALSFNLLQNLINSWNQNCLEHYFNHSTSLYRLECNSLSYFDLHLNSFRKLDQFGFKVSCSLFFATSHINWAPYHLILTNILASTLWTFISDSISSQFLFLNQN